MQNCDYNSDSNIKQFAKLLMLAITGNKCAELDRDFETLSKKIEQTYSNEKLKEMGTEIYSAGTDTLLMAAVGLWPPSTTFDINQSGLNNNIDNLLKKLGLD